MPEEGAKVLGTYIIYVALPALVLLHVHDLSFESSLLFAALMPHGVFAVSFIVFRLLGTWLAWDKRTIVCLTLTAGLGNTSFVGIPMIQAFFGQAHVGTGILIDQAGSFLCLSTSGILYLIFESSRSGDSGFSSDSGQTAQKNRLQSVLTRIITFPPFIALIVALVLRWLDYNHIMREVLTSIGSTLTPVAMVAVGFQIRFTFISGRLKHLTWGLIFRLLLSPALVAILALAVNGGLLHNGLVLEGPILGTLPAAFQVTIFEAAMPPMITAGILCIEYDMDPDLAGLMLGLGIPISFITLPLMHSLFI